jgi:hypothetical protein
VVFWLTFRRFRVIYHTEHADRVLNDADPLMPFIERRSNDAK